MATTIATMATLNAKCLSFNNHHHHHPKPATIKPIISLLSLQNLPKGLSISKTSPSSSASSSNGAAAAAIAGAVFSTLSVTDTAIAAQQIADLAEGSDNRGLALLLPLIPAILWVLYNILQPALNQLNRMRSDKGVVVGLGAGGLATLFAAVPPSASAASEISLIAAAADATASSSDSRGLLLLFVVAPAIAWVLYNILQPALNQINRMRSG